MNLRELSIAVLTKPKWMALWYLTNSTLAGFTLVFLSRTGYTPFDDATAFLLGFFVPLGVYGFKHLMGLYRYRRNLGVYQVTEEYLHRVVGLYGHGKYKESMHILQYVLEILPGHKRALYFAGATSEKLEDWNAASRYYSEYLLLEPTDQEVIARLDSMESQAQQN